MSRAPKTGEELVEVLQIDGPTTVWFQNVEIDDDLAKQVSAALAKNKSVTFLRLSSNNLGDERVGLIVAGLLENTMLKHLEISKNNITVSGVTEIAQVLQSNMSVKRLDLTSNDIDDNGAGVISRLLEQNQTLTNINLSGNPIGLAGATLLLRAFDKNDTLIKLKYKNRNLATSQEYKQIQAKIIEALEANKAKQAERKKAAFDEAKNSLDTTGPWHRCKLMVIGEGMVGKTATVRSLVGEKFIEAWESTVGVSLVSSKTSTWQNIPTRVEYGGYIQAFAADRASELLKEQQLSENTTLEEAWMLGYRAAMAGLPPNPPFKRKTKLQEIDAGALVELAERRSARSVKKRSPRRSAKSARNPAPAGTPAETGAKRPAASVARMFEKFVDDAEKDDGVALTIWDYGGQDVFHALHHLFLTQYGIYMLVFDMRKLLDDSKETRASIRFWLNSVKMHADQATVVAVGTFVNELNPEQVNVVQEQFGSMVKASRQVCRNEAADLDFFPIDNKSRDGILELKQVIRVETKQLEFVNRSVSINWIKTLDSMNWEARGSYWLTMKDARRIGKTNYVSSAVEMDKLLDFFHELGVLVHFTKTQALYDTVILYPEWIVQEMAKVIRDSSIHKYDMDGLKSLKLDGDLEELFKFGLASVDLLEHFWGADSLNFMLDLMRSLALASDWKFGGKETKYFIPSMVQESKKSLPKPEGMRAVFDFSKFYLPNGVFERVVCGFVEHSGRLDGVPEPVLEKEGCLLWFAEDAPIQLRKEGESFELFVAKEVASLALHFLMARLNLIKNEVMANLVWNVQLQVDEGLQRYEDVRSTARDPWFKQNESVKITDASLDKLNQ